MRAKGLHGPNCTPNPDAILTLHAARFREARPLAGLEAESHVDVRVRRAGRVALLCWDPRLRAARQGEHRQEGPRRAECSEHDGRTHAVQPPGEHQPPEVSNQGLTVNHGAPTAGSGTANLSTGGATDYARVQEGVPLSMPSAGPKDTSGWLAQNAGDPSSGTMGRSGADSRFPAQADEAVADVYLAVAPLPKVSWLARLGKWLKNLLPEAKVASTVLGRAPAQLASKFKHAADFGITGNYSKDNAAEFSRAIHGHVNSPGVRAVHGTYHKAPVTHYVDPSSGLNVIADPAGNFVSGWRLSPEQLQNVLTHGGL